MHALESALLLCDQVNPRAQAAQTDARIVRATAYLLEHLRDPVSVADAARHVGLSSSRLSHLFRIQTGQTLLQFVERERLARAKQLLLLSGRTVTQIANEVGYENPFYFTLRFKKHTGSSPTEWKRQESGATK